MKTDNILEFNKDCFNIESLYSRVGVIVEEFDGKVPAEVDPGYITGYILDLRKYLAENTISPSQIVLHEDGAVELLFYPINADKLDDKSLNSIAYDLEIEFAFLDRIKVEIPDNIISAYHPELTQAEMYYLFIAGLTLNTKDFNNNLLSGIPTPENADVIKISVAN